MTKAEIHKLTMKRIQKFIRDFVVSLEDNDDSCDQDRQVVENVENIKLGEKQES